MPYYYGRVVGVEVYENDVVVKRDGVGGTPEGVTRGEITMFTRQARARLAFVAANTSITFRTMITLTYPAEYPTDGQRVKRDLKAFLDWLRRETGGCEYLWFLEFQKRGAPHFHILIDTPWPRRRAEETALRDRVASTWYRIADTGDAKHLAAGTRTERLRSSDGGARYAVKYAAKMRQKAVPLQYRNVGRFWGHSKGVKPRAKAKARCTEDDIRAVLEGWDYAPNESRPVYHTLYNTSNRFLLWMDTGFDNWEDAWYTGAERQ
jgi:hypothetical protein